MTDNTPRNLTRRRYLSLTAASGAALGLGAGTAAAENHTRKDVTIRAEESTNPVDIVATVYRPAGASPDDPVPMILHSHGWGGSRDSGAGAFRTELGAGFGVLSFDQRGHGQSGGQAYVQSPEREGQDVIAILDHVAGLDWVARSEVDSGFGGGSGGATLPPQASDVARDATAAERPAPSPADDPMVFAMGGSYGGGYQLVGAFTELRDKGYTRLDALAPQITWHDLPESLAPRDVVRTTWVSALYGAGAPMVPQHVHEGFAYGATTGQWPDGEPAAEPDLDARFHGNGPVAFVEEGLQLDIPVLFGQGLSDNLFNFNQAWKNFERSLTDDARARSAVVGYNGGHALPNMLPPGTTSTANPAGPTNDFDAARLAFFEGMRDGTDDARSVIGSPYLLATASGSRAVRVDSVDDRTAYGEVDLQVRSDGEGGLAPGLSAAATTTGAGAPVHLPLANGPLTVAGVPDLSATVTTLGVDQRLFAALSVGRSPATAKVLQNNVMPLHAFEPIVQDDRTIELPGVAADVGPREQLYLTLSAASDMFPAHGSARTPGTVLLEDLSVGVPLTDN